MKGFLMSQPKRIIALVGSYRKGGVIDTATGGVFLACVGPRRKEETMP